MVLQSMKSYSLGSYDLAHPHKRLKISMVGFAINVKPPATHRRVDASFVMDGKMAYEVLTRSHPRNIRSKRQSKSIMINSLYASASFLDFEMISRKNILGIMSMNVMEKYKRIKHENEIRKT
jgi:hypothetical protein